MIHNELSCFTLRSSLLSALNLTEAFYVLQTHGVAEYIAQVRITENFLGLFFFDQ